MIAVNPYIHSIEYYLPENKLTNKELSNFFGDWSEEKIYSKIGVKERRISNKNEYVSDIAEKSARKLFDKQNIDPNEINFLILCTQSPDYYLPTTACILQEKLNLPKTCGAFDFNLGCSGFIYGLSIAESLINNNTVSNVLLITADTYTKHVNQMDKSTRTIFGDAGAAILLKSGSEENKIGKFVFGTDGSGANNLIVPSGGMKIPRSDKTSIESTDKYGNTRSLNNLYMNGPKIYEFVLEHIPPTVEKILLKNNLDKEEIDLFVFHQASSYMLEKLRRRLKIPKEKFFANIENIGNTVSASIPIALKDAQNSGLIKNGSKIMLVGFGVGYSWGGTIITY
ncbi:MAG: ketoacyl-ACP synthase III [Clostridiales bacterium]